MRKHFLYILVFALSQTGFCQTDSILGFSEYLGYIKKFHPIVKQANLVISEAEAKLMKARGSFDPKLEVDYATKEFKQTEYYDKLNAAFKIPTWYGIELKGNFEDNTGVYLNPESKVPYDGLYSVGVSVSLAKGLLMNERMATLKQAKLYQQQAAADNQLLVNEILYKAAQTYFNWLKSYREKLLYEEFLSNAELRFNGVRKSHQMGDKPAIDTTEARIAFSSRKLNLEKANLNYLKATLELSNFLWINDVPVEVQDSLFPDTQTRNYINEALKIQTVGFENGLSNHPKLQSLGFKSMGLEVEKRLKRNNLLPEIGVQYNFLSQTPTNIDTYNTSNYKAGIAVRFPLFLRKERAELKLADYKLQAIDFERQLTEISLKNKLNTVQQEITSYEKQMTIADDMVKDYIVLLKGEERKFDAGDSSLFLINSRESKLIENKLKLIELENFLLNSKGKLFNVLGL